MNRNNDVIDGWKALRLLRAAVFMVVLYANRTEAALLVSGWGLQNRAIVSSNEGVFGNQTNIGTNSPVPVTDTHTNAIGETTAQLTYSYDWSGDSGTFRVDGTHTAIHPTASLVQSGSNGVVYFQPSVDSLITLHVRYNYQLPDGFMEAVGSGAVSDDSAEIAYAQLYVVDFSFGPTSGSFDQAMTAVVPAGCNCSFGFTMRLTTEATSIAATDNGTVELSIVPLPEPATLLPLALGAMVLRQRRNRNTR